MRNKVEIEKIRDRGGENEERSEKYGGERKSETASKASKRKRNKSCTL